MRKQLEEFIEKLEEKICIELEKDFPELPDGSINQKEMLKRHVRACTLGEVKYNLELLLES